MTAHLIYVLYILQPIKKLWDKSRILSMFLWADGWIDKGVLVRCYICWSLSLLFSFIFCFQFYDLKSTSRSLLFESLWLLVYIVVSIMGLWISAYIRNIFEDFLVFDYTSSLQNLGTLPSSYLRSRLQHLYARTEEDSLGRTLPVCRCTVALL